MDYVHEQQAGYVGSFNKYLSDVGAAHDVLGLAPDPIPPQKEEIVPKEQDPDVAIDAHVSRVTRMSPYCIMLGEREDNSIVSPELLLAALEGLHIDNARIEVEGYFEVRCIRVSVHVWRTGVDASVDMCDDVMRHSASPGP
jgi:hypothetical protein